MNLLAGTAVCYMLHISVLILQDFSDKATSFRTIEDTASNLVSFKWEACDLV